MSKENNPINEYLRELIIKEAVLKYLFVKSMENKYNDEYLNMKYRINTKNIREEYDVIGKERRAGIEKELRAKIEAGEIDLDKEAARWHREALIKLENDNKFRENRYDTNANKIGEER